MFIDIDLNGRAPVVTLAEADDCGKFHVAVTGHPDPERLAQALKDADVGTPADDDHVWVSIGAVRRMAEGRVGDGWAADFDGMLGYAASKGWLNPDGDAIRAHCEWETVTGAAGTGPAEASLDAAALSDIYRIEQLKSRYFRFVDTKDWVALRELFTDGLLFYMEKPVLPQTTEPVTVGGDAFVEHVSRVLRTAVTAHHGHTPDIELTGPRTAHGVWAMFDSVDDAERGRAILGFGHYHEDYEKGDDGRWRIKVMRLTRIRVDSHEPSRPAGARPWPPPWSRG